MDVITGFGPFGSVIENPSTPLARRVAQRVGARAVSLPTSYERSASALREAVEVERPRVLLMFGLAQGVRGLRIESIGRNEASATLVDVDGVAMTGRLQEPTGPSERLVTFAQALAAKVSTASCPAFVSTTAGGYVCNWTMYAALGLPVAMPAFVHVGETVDDAVLEGASAVHAALRDAEQGGVH